MPVRIQRNEGVAEIQGDRCLCDGQFLLYPFGVQGIDGLVVGNRKRQFTATTRSQGCRFYCVPGPEQHVMQNALSRSAVFDLHQGHGQLSVMAKRNGACAAKPLVVISSKVAQAKCINSPARPR